MTASDFQLPVLLKIGHTYHLTHLSQVKNNMETNYYLYIDQSAPKPAAAPIPEDFPTTLIPMLMPHLQNSIFRCLTMPINRPLHCFCCWKLPL